jgi:rhamnosyltransferase
MKSTSGDYFQALDHVRALAAFTVFFWHFNHFNGGHLAAPLLLFPLSFLTEGHTGVAIFMTLSGYLFAKLLNQRKIVFLPFLWNRFIRLAPLLFVVICLSTVVAYIKGTLDLGFIKSIAKGVIFPSLPNGGWSIIVESHFYVILPLLLYLVNRSKLLLVLALALPIGLRLLLFIHNGEVQSFAYYTIVGRLDQFILGIFAFYTRDFYKDKGRYIFVALVCFLLFWYWFDRLGGFYTLPKYPSPSPIWILLPTIEGFVYSVLIAWYDSVYTQSESKIARFIALIGTYSYSIYLLHFFFVFRMPALINKYLFDISNPYLIFLVAIPCFLSLIPISYLSYRFVEEPFLKYRKKYYA